MPENDRDLILRAKKGDMDAFEMLYSGNTGRMYNVALRILGSDSDAQDAVQDAMLKAWRALHTFKFRSAFSTWLYRILVNTCNDMLKKNKKNVISLERLQQDGIEPAQEGFERYSIQRDVIAQVLLRLSPEHREILVLRDVQGMAYEEISEILSVPLGTVRSRINRARENFKKLYFAHGTNEYQSGS